MPTLLLKNADALVTMDAQRREIPGGGVFVRDGVIEAVGPSAELPQTADTWQVDWVETTRDRQGTVKGVPVTMRALVTTYTADTTPQTTDEQLRNNPMSIYVRDFSWSRLQ